MKHCAKWRNFAKSGHTVSRYLQAVWYSNERELQKMEEKGVFVLRVNIKREKIHTYLL